MLSYLQDYIEDHPEADLYDDLADEYLNQLFWIKDPSESFEYNQMNDQSYEYFKYILE